MISVILCCWYSHNAADASLCKYSKEAQLHNFELSFLLKLPLCTYNLKIYRVEWWWWWCIAWLAGWISGSVAIHSQTF